VQDAENLAWKLAFVRHGWAPPALLDSYDIERRAAAAENLRVTGATMEFLVPQTDEQRAFRRATLDRAVTEPAARRLINSGKLAEPYWYLDSPLTTPGAVADFPEEPGVPRPAVPGVLCPDGPCVVPRRSAGLVGRGSTGQRTRLRRLFGRGFVVLAPHLWGDLADGAGTKRKITGRVGFPVEAYALDEIDVDGVLRSALDSSSDRVHLVRPDGHLAAVLSGPDDLPAALRRACGGEGV
jgi:hypothetical protein